MVFDSLKQSLTDFTDTVTNPLDSISEVTKSMKEKVLGPDTTLVEKITDNLRYDPYKEVFDTQIKKCTNALKKKRIAKTKKEALLQAIETLRTQVDSIPTFSRVTKKVPTLLQQFEAILKEGNIPGAYEDKNFITTTKSLTTKDTNTVLTLFQEAQIEITAQIRALDNDLLEQKILPLETDYSYSVSKNMFHDDRKDAIRKLIDDEYEVSALQKKLLYHTKELLKQQRLLATAQGNKRTGRADKDTTRRINHATTKIQTLLNKDIPNILRALHTAAKQITTDETTIHDLWTTYEDAFAAHEKVLHTRLMNNRKRTKSVIQEEKATRKKLTTTRKKEMKNIPSTYSSLVSTAKKIQHTTSSDTFKKQLTAASDEFSTYTELQIDYLSSYAKQMYEHLADIQAYNIYIAHIKAYALGTHVLEKERIIQLKILLGLKKKHAKMSNDIWHNLLEASKDIKLGTITKEIKEHSSACDQQYKDYQVEIGERKKNVQSLLRMIQQVQVAETASEHSSQWLQHRYLEQIHTAYISSLKALTPLYTSWHTALSDTHTLLDKRITQLHKEHDTLQQKESPTQKDKTTMKKTTTSITYLEHIQDMVEHQQETAADSKEHHAESIAYNKKIIKAEQTKNKFYTKQATKYIKKLKKADHISEQLPLPKSYTGTTL